MPFVDVNVFVYHLAADQKYGEKARKIIERMVKYRIRLRLL
jgi:predicted nucleic acid-binding protein